MGNKLSKKLKSKRNRNGNSNPVQATSVESTPVTPNLQDEEEMLRLAIQVSLAEGNDPGQAPGFSSATSNPAFGGQASGAKPPGLSLSFPATAPPEEDSVMAELARQLMAQERMIAEDEVFAQQLQQPPSPPQEDEEFARKLQLLTS
eukprot:CAMPEP_0117861756 /NCGR_PEP_ID=MMETSP0950-20121206/4556_1 /TAXON_ID=44440 /ORGANISM="Chattonella subsalsa, Strain CCMP2191" /LENGTH=146 /DNA_ID=CAMNT_0005712157 /DNA_START=102 /DNA_END=542 /DNA_ORIENTATION=-